MREIEYREIKREKCHMCGCLNKVFIELFDDNQHFIGYGLKCCNCGRYIEYLLDVEHNDDEAGHRSYHTGKKYCIQSSYCPWEVEGKCYLPKMSPYYPKPDPVDPNKHTNHDCECAWDGSVHTRYILDDRFK